MYGLLYKDFIVNKKNMLILFGAAAFMHILQFTSMFDTDTSEDMKAFVFQFLNILTVVSAFMIIGVFQNSIYEQDERKKFAYYITASETGIKTHVQEKYLFTYLVSVMGMILCILLNSLAMDIGGNTYSNSGFCIIMFFVQIFLRAIEIPFTMAFGSKRGNNVKSVMLLSALLIVIIYLLFGDLSMFGSIDDFWESFFALFDVDENPNIVIALSLAGLGAMGLYYISYRISCKVYLKGVGSYAK